MGQFWYGRRGPEGPDYYELVNLLGDQGRSPRSLERGRPPPALGSVGLEFLNLAGGGGGLETLPSRPAGSRYAPGAPADPGALTLPPGARVAALIIPGELARAPDPGLLSLQPEIIVIYGSPKGPFPA